MKDPGVALFGFGPWGRNLARVLTRDVPDHALVVGNPASVAGWVCSCGVRLAGEGHVLDRPECGAAYRRDGDRVSSLREVEP